MFVLDSCTQEVVDLETIERRYAEENNLVDAVTKGDEANAKTHVERLLYLYPHAYLCCELPYMQNVHAILTTLLRKGAEIAEVHPVQIDELSRRFGGIIYCASDVSELNNLAAQMASAYCKLVQRYSLKGYTFLVRNIVSEITVDSLAAYTLTGLAKRYSVSPSYLSTLFKLETGTTLTGFIRMKRLEKAKQLLKASTIPVQTVAEQCGYTDVNYFSRLFKREYGEAPSKYRLQCDDNVGIVVRRLVG